MTYRPSLSVATAVLLVALANPATAQTPRSRTNSPDASVPARAGHPDSPDRRICVIQHATGSRLPQKICQSRRDWELDGGVPTEDED